MKCPECGSTNVQTERRPDGNSRCVDCSHYGPSTSFHRPSTPRPDIRHVSSVNKPQQMFKTVHVSDGEKTINGYIRDGWRVVNFQDANAYIYVLFEKV